MAAGSFDDRTCPTIEVTVLGPNGSKTVTAVIDTGFTGFLSVAPEHLEEVGLSPEATTTIEFADRRTAEVELCLGTARLEDTDEREGICLFGQPGSGTLLGMTFLFRFNLSLYIDVCFDTVQVMPSAHPPAQA